MRNAKICTFHSFCQSVIRNHFQEIGIDPSFRIGDETELTLLKRELMEQIFEEQYAIYNEKKKSGEELSQQDKAFIQLVECYSSGKSDEGLMDILLQLYEFAMSDPWPEEWLDEKKQVFRLESVDQMEETDWLCFLMTYLNNIVEDLLKLNQEGMEICKEADGPDMYEDNLQQDRTILEQLKECDSYTAYGQVLDGIKWSRLSGKRSDVVDPDKRAYVKSLRDKVKKTVEDLQKKFFFQDAEQMYEDLCALEQPMVKLLDLVKEFKARYDETKEEKRLMDFHDLEHHALKILVDRETKQPTRVAEQYQEYFAELMVDEYQDSNEVQETILRSICKREPDAPNIFMVGDVKQSIYKFRMARPELFMEKYDTYSLEDSLYQRIDLDKNFRSRGVVLDTVNEIFRVIMHRSLGNVEYDEHAALHLGNTGFLETERTSSTTELLLYVPEEEEAEQKESTQQISTVELEARMVAGRIKELVDGDEGLQIVDKKTGLLRNCGYGDIAILLRSMGSGDTYLEVLKKMGIPVYTDTRTGYFSTFEIQIILEFLKVLDNPRQDIPLAAVMRSVLGGFCAEELAVMRCRYENCSLMDAVEAYAALNLYGKGEEIEGVDVALSKKADEFLQLLEQFRDRIPYTPIHQLLEQIYEETGFYDYVSVMPNGAQRRDNLDMLIQKALDMEATGRSTLFHFNRYIEKLHKYEVDFGEAAGGEGTEQAVRIMTIHKSKGLEFPVVFVGAMGKRFNNMEAQSKLVMHLHSGIGADLIDYEKRTKMPSLIKRAIVQQNSLENLGEELRVLYVALTRAKEKLIMAGVLEDEKILDQWQLHQGEMDYFTRVNAKNYLDWVGPVVMDSKNPGFQLRTVTLEQLVQDEMKEQVKHALKREELLQWDAGQQYDEKLAHKLDELQNFVYPFERERQIKSKMTVTELKQREQKQIESEQYGELLFDGMWTREEEEPEEELVVPLPTFLSEQKETVTGANRGTLYHKVFEKLNLPAVHTEEDVERELKKMQQQGILAKTEAAMIRRSDLVCFAETSLGQRMAKAHLEHKIWREQPFVFGVPARQVDPQWDSDTLVLVQGIVDAYFEEDGQLVVVDYKTDHVKTKEQLKNRYQTQLDYYQKALEQITGKKVKEKIIYSVALGTEILLD